MTQQFSTEWGGKTLTIETGKLAGQASGACTVRYGDTVVLATAVMSDNIREGIDFFPLIVDFEEKLYAAGKIKGSRFIKREGRPSDEAILTGRLVDRGMRPLFDDTLRNEVQLIMDALSFDGENDPDVLSIIAASCALNMSDIPWNGPIGGIRVGQIDGEWVINPSYEARLKSTLDLMISGTPEKIMMIEAGANQVSEETFLEALVFAQKHLRPVMELINEVRQKAGVPKRILKQDVDADPETSAADENEVVSKTRAYLAEKVSEVMFAKPLMTKADRKGAFTTLKTGLEEMFNKENIGKDRRKAAFTMFKKIVEEFITEKIIKDGRRLDGRALTEIRPLTSEVAVLPRTHGSGLFSRGETQVLSVATLGSPGMEQTLEGIEGDSKKRYMHHYNFPPFSVGETGPMRGPGRREIGHGALAEKALVPVLPSKEEFPYTVRVVSEVLSSNGSSSMGSTCGSTLALMDAGVPIKAPVAGIAMGLASDKNGDWKVITDLQDLEDGPGGMDFKIAGTETGITAIQMDTKTLGLTPDILKQTFNQARDARLQILKVMASAIGEVRRELSQYAPRIIAFKIPIDKIREVIGPGGKIINGIIAETGVQIDIEQDGMVSVTSVNAEGLDKAVQMIKDIIRTVEPGEIFEGTVVRIEDFGAFVQVLPNQDGLVHVSEMDWERVRHPSDLVKLGDKVKVIVREIDEKGRINLSMRQLKPQPEGWTPPPPMPRGPGGFGGPRRGPNGPGGRGGRPRY
ncbi:MAG: polyribonucleotide nucleotidyltransferase, polyribonucleotide nucleotidyltransferase [Candidatus Magasanikbacteria bacterium]|nr:polyribonucleotide nucleotidyltransferase, polyribonucleotide nucleotidyltransferase [Candidatus Magasanikbacteria bacterium]